MESEEVAGGYKNGGILDPGAAYYRNAHPWKCEVFLPLRPTPEQIEVAVLIRAFQDDIDLIDTSALDELP
ncbi:hypothetical protein ABZT06_08320 [Streptomyces sp. NPDC005483]|uniref:hypothetical protein n=1 Tax=Streptomyces sp. NPDC005483 TaxID=3154882 RepID=UPI0033AE252D